MIYFLLLLVSCFGILLALYLIHKRWALTSPICPMGGRCDLVLTSKYNKTFGVHNDLTGLLFFVVIAGFSILVILGNPLVGQYFRLILSVVGVAVTIAALMSLRFLYLQWRVIKAWCFWCVVSAMTVFFIEIITLYLYFNS